MKFSLAVLFCIATVVGEFTLKWGGYYENDISALFMRDSSALYDKNKLKITLSLSYDSVIEVQSSVFFQKYFGTIERNHQTFLPESLSTLIPDTVNYKFDYTPWNDTIAIQYAYLKIEPKRFQLIAGIQDLRWGSGYWHNPSNFWSVPNRLDPEYDRNGIPAIKLGFKGDKISFFAINGFNEDLKDIPFSLLFGFNMDKFSILATGGTEVNRYKYFSLLQDKWKFRKYMAGLSTNLTLGKGEIWIEGAWNRIKTKKGFYNQYNGITNNSDERLTTTFKKDRDYLQFVLGFEREFDLTEGLNLKIEYYLNTDGKTRGNSYYLEDWIEFLNKENEGIVANSLYGEIKYHVTKKTAIAFLFIGNHCDQSMFFKPSIHHILKKYLKFELYANLPRGKDSSEFGKDHYEVRGRAIINW